MPIPDPKKSDIANSARAHLARGLKTIKEIVRAIANKFGFTRATDYAVITGIVRQQITAAESAEEAINSATGKPNINNLPIDWSLKNQPGKYGYTIRATYTDPETGRSTDTIVVVSSNTLLSAQEALSQAQRIAESLQFKRLSTNPSIEEMVEPEVSTELLSIGRKP